MISSETELTNLRNDCLLSLFRLNDIRSKAETESFDKSITKNWKQFKERVELNEAAGVTPTTNTTSQMQEQYNLIGSVVDDVQIDKPTLHKLMQDLKQNFELADVISMDTNQGSFSIDLEPKRQNKLQEISALNQLRDQLHALVKATINL